MNDNDYNSFSDNDVILILKVIVKMIIQFKQYLYRMAASVLRKKTAINAGPASTSILKLIPSF